MRYAFLECLWQLLLLMLNPGFEYGQHHGHTCPQGFQSLSVDSMYHAQGKTPIHVRRDDLLGSTLKAIGR
jgi:hypothetical protein